MFFLTRLTTITFMKSKREKSQNIQFLYLQGQKDLRKNPTKNKKHMFESIYHLLNLINNLFFINFCIKKDQLKLRSFI